MMRVLHKSWGVKTELFKNDLCEVSILQLNKGQRCSWHRHRSKWNQFFVISGWIDVVTEDGTSMVKEGQVFTTNPMQWHEFRTPNSTAVVQEIMYVKYEAEDIERENKGGPLGETPPDTMITEVVHPMCDHRWQPAGTNISGAKMFHCPECGTWRYDTSA